MKRKKLPLHIRLCYEPTRLARDNLVTAYEKLCPDKKITLPGKPVNSSSYVNPPGTKENGR